MLYEQILKRYPDLFTQKEAAEITALLKSQPDNKYLTAVVMCPYIFNEPEAHRRAVQNFLVFMEEAKNPNSAFARIVVNEAVEEPWSRLKWFYVGLTKEHPIYGLLLAGENDTRKRKGLQPVYEVTYNSDFYNYHYSLSQTEAMNEIKNYALPAPGFWWPN